MMRDKKKITQSLIQQLPVEHAVNIKQAMSTWWCNHRATGGMRLTEHGFVVLSQQLQLINYACEINNKSLNSKIMLKLDRKLQMPYFICIEKKIPKKIFFFSSKEAMLVQLYGNLTKFITNYE